MILQNPIFFLLDNYYNNKYVEDRKSLRNKSISYFISNTFKRSQSNRKFKKKRPIFNAICSLYFKRNVVFLKLEEIKELLDEIDNGYEIEPRKFHLEEYYKEEVMSSANYKSLCKYNFYDALLFEYATLGDRMVIFKKIEKYNLDIRKCDFI